MYHTAMLDRTADRRRDNQFGAVGYSVLRFTWSDLIDSADECARLIRQRARLPAA
jgi:very-short-patch-repair endonuclease